MKNVIVKIEAKTSQVFLNKKTLGISGENLQGEIIFEFTDEFVNGVAWLEVQMPNGEKGYLECSKQNNTYVLPILSSLLTEVGNIEMQLRITENGIDEIPVFKSNKFYLEVKEAINATTTIPEEYLTWIDIANTKLNEIDEAISQIDNIDIIGTKEGATTTITITNKDGEEESFNIYDGNDYILTEEDKKEIVDTTKPLVEAEIQPTLENIESIAENAEVIARGRATGYVFDTVEELDIWLQDETNISQLVLGDNLYVRALGVPDYWWDGEQKQVLEAEKPDLTEYAKKEQFVTLTQEEYDNLEEKSANTYYFIIEEE